MEMLSLCYDLRYVGHSGCVTSYKMQVYGIASLLVRV